MTPSEFSSVVWIWIKCAALAFFIGAAAIYLTMNVFSIGLDDTDVDAWHRSGLAIYTDHKTGVQYLGTRNGGLAVRVDKDGRPMWVTP